MLESAKITTYSTDLPTLLVKELDALRKSKVNNQDNFLTKGEYRKSLILFDRLFKNQARKTGDYRCYYPLPSTYLEEIDPNYIRFVSKLKKAGLLEVFKGINSDKEAFSKALGLCKNYRIKPALLAEGQTQVTIEIKGKEAVHLRATPEPWNSQIIQDLSQLDFDSLAAKQWLDEHLTNLDLTRWRLDHNTPEYRANTRMEGVRFGYNLPVASRRTYYAQALVKEVATEPNHRVKSIFKLNEGYVVTTPQEFRTRKTESIRLHYENCIRKLEDREFWVTEALTNQRLHHNLTEMPKALLDFLTLHGEKLVEVDIANSQVALLAFCMQHGDVLGLGADFPELPVTPRTQAFLDDAQQGVIYDQLAHEMPGGDREVAKKEIIRWLFSGAGFNLPKKSFLAQRYGEVVQWVRQAKQVLKALHPEENSADEDDDPKLGLAVYLQRLESELMIHKIYPRAKEHGFTLFSKHDSFLVPISDAPAVQQLMQEVLTSHGIVMNIRYKEAPVPSDLVTLQQKAPIYADCNY